MVTLNHYGNTPVLTKEKLKEITLSLLSGEQLPVVLAKSIIAHFDIEMDLTGQSNTAPDERKEILNLVANEAIVNRTELKNKIVETYTNKRIELIKMFDERGLEVGSQGFVDHIDDAGTLHMKWDNGRSLGVCFSGGDLVKIID